MPVRENKPGETWIIGLGNSRRRDDGLGPYVTERLGREFEKNETGIILRAFSELDPTVIMDLRRAELVLFVDATPTPLNKGLDWSKIDGWIESLPYLTHHYSPQFILGLLHRIYRHYPETWLVSIEGEDFDQGEGLTPKAAARAERALGEITAFVTRKRVDSPGLAVNYKQDRSEQWTTEKISLL